MEHKTLFTKLYGYFPIAFVSVLLCWTFYVHLFRLSIPLIKQGSVGQGVAYIVLYHTFLFLFVFSYIRVTSKDAGSPKTSLEDAAHSSRNPFELDRNPWVEELESPNLSEKDEMHGLSALTVVRSNTSTTGDQAQRSDDPEAVKRALTGSEVRPAPPLLSPPPTAPENIATLPPPKAKYCNTCNAMKPERCHHCSTCDKCVLKMDQL
ncbi:palmitoyltransferase for Vac8p, partial [Basidiobolus ranarum]